MAVKTRRVRGVIVHGCDVGVHVRAADAAAAAASRARLSHYY